MNCQTLATPSVSSPLTESKSGFRSQIKKTLRSFGKYWTEQNLASSHIETNARTAREEIFLKYGHLMMK